MCDFTRGNLSYAQPRRPAAHYALYVWKDIYIIILVETFWSLANVVFVIKDAKKTYGLFCASGAIGGLLEISVEGNLRQFMVPQPLFGLQLPIDHHRSP